MLRWQLLSFSALILLAGVNCQQVGTLKSNAVLRVPMEECEAGESCRKSTLSVWHSNCFIKFGFLGNMQRSVMEFIEAFMIKWISISKELAFCRRNKHRNIEPINNFNDPSIKSQHFHISLEKCLVPLVVSLFISPLQFPPLQPWMQTGDGSTTALAPIAMMETLGVTQNVPRLQLAHKTAI